MKRKATSAEKIMKSKAFMKATMDRRMAKRQSDAIWRDATERLTSILRQYQAPPKGMHGHTDHFIFPAAAIYLSAKKVLGEQAAYKIIEDTSILRSEEYGRMLAKLMRVPGMKDLFIRIWDPLTRKKFGAESGFRNVFYPKKKGEYRMDILACPYCRYFTELGCPELTKVFCANDNRVYGNLPGIRFERTGTLGTGAERCDFYIKKV